MALCACGHYLSTVSTAFRASTSFPWCPPKLLRMLRNTQLVLALLAKQHSYVQASFRPKLKSQTKINFINFKKKENRNHSYLRTPTTDWFTISKNGMYFG
jgi:hypothetical protein